MAGKISIIIAVFQPHGINQLLGISAHELKDGIVETDQIFGRQGSLLHEQLSEQSSWKTKLQLLNTFFLKQAANRSLSDQSLIYSTLNYIVKNRGTISVNDLVKYTGYSERHIQRIFSECVGINPKKFGSIVKLHFFLNLLKYKSRKNSITGFCYEAGYSDQAHLIKEFKKYTGITPTQYLNHTNRLTTNFMEIQWDELQMSGLYNFQLNA